MWDMRLIKAYYLHESYKVNGFPVYWEESPDVKFVAKRKIIRSAETIDRAKSAWQKANQNKEPHGLHWYAVPVFIGDKRPTRQEWIEKQMAKAQKGASLDGIDLDVEMENLLKEEQKREELIARSEERAKRKLEALREKDSPDSPTV